MTPWLSERAQLAGFAQHFANWSCSSGSLEEYSFDAAGRVETGSARFANGDKGTS